METVDGQNIQSLDNFQPTPPPNFKVVFFFQGFRRVDKRNQIPQHDMSRTRCLTLTFRDGGVMPIFSSGFEYFVHLRHTYKFNKSFSELNQRHYIATKIQFVYPLYGALQKKQPARGVAVTLLLESKDHSMFQASQVEVH